MQKWTDKEKKYFKEIKQIEKEYYSLSKQFNVNFPKALNFEQEKTKFFRAIADDKYYNPKFIYEKKYYDENVLLQLKALKISTKNDLYGFKKLYKHRLKAKLYEIECHKNWGKPISTKYVKKYRGEPSRYLLSLAKTYCRRYKREKVKFKTLTCEQVAQRLVQEVHRLTQSILCIVFVQIPSKVNIFGKTLKINPNVRLTSLDVRRLKVHEIGVHFLRYFNGSKTNMKILEYGTANYIETEEGLAVYAEEQKNVLSKAHMYIYAGRVIGTFYALKYSFFEVFSILKYYGFKNEDAFAITYRAKRNISDTSQKGGFTKDYVYFSGYHKVKKWAKNNDVKDLFIGKIKIEDVKLLKKYIKLHKDEIKSVI